MLDFSKAISEGHPHVKFRDLRVGETFVLPHETENEVNVESQYVYIKSDKTRALELNESDLDFIGESFSEDTNVIRVEITVASISIIK